MPTSMMARVSTNTYCIGYLGLDVSVDSLKAPLDVLHMNARRLRIPYN